MPEQMTQGTSVNETSAVRVAKEISSSVREIQNSISRRAFEIFEANGRLLGRDLEDWLQAESELLYPVSLDISESDGALVVRGALPGFKAKDIEVKIEPSRLTIVGKRATEEVDSAAYVGAWMLQTVDLPVQVDAGRVTGSLKDGNLELTLPVAEALTAIKIQSAAA